MGLAPLLEIVAYDFYLYESVAGLSIRFAKMRDPALRRYVGRNGAATGAALLFSCLNLKPKLHRFAVAAFLESLGVVDRCLLTLHGSPSELEALMLDVARMFEGEPEQSGVIDAARRLMSRAPLHLGSDRAQVEAGIYRPASDPDVWNDVLLLDRRTAAPSPLAQARFDIVSETWFTDDTCLYLTEKMSRPICLLKPFLIAGPPGLLGHLRSLGFKTFSPVIDERYDEAVAPTVRMQTLCRELARLAAMEETALRALVDALGPIVRHNQEHLLRHGATWSVARLRRTRSQIIGGQSDSGT
jgi:hypothetical protein